MWAWFGSQGSIALNWHSRYSGTWLYFLVSTQNTGTGTMRKWPAQVSTVVANGGRELSLLSYQHKTAMLKFYPQYPEMQHNLIDTIIGINTNIISINQSRHAFTPKLADTIITKPGKNKKHRIHYSRLVDGVHPTESVKGDWARILMQAITKNRSGAITRPLRTAALAQPPSPDSDSDSDHDNTKRNWKY